jgi:hypothetical protein
MRGDERGKEAMFYPYFWPSKEREPYKFALISPAVSDTAKDSQPPNLPDMDHQQTKLSHETVPLQRNPERRH